ncbi:MULTISPECIES: CHRD domain-containing protein [Bacillus cereus group]|uniref:CHRD domain-containing protein n=1 Tax=Bacillus cereus group TaxID=86661 RepID=UPI0008646512|nr:MULTISPECIES: CHRD domain-containing protein [Bacillus cereus group]AWC30509.1 CHRD domain-containing protein [Bacillus cytotoxicus]AWC42651.1 CHRD domain-containing protein [Bacillus cytotoxicus]AWC50582.1 CHRD domain-containing protein [Bacillus cytotoxicus]AWC58760.1 CHRD domain-containing protein [Bacillus cytotoxicus]AWC66897.1 CHRD domain-containing protein [Bacillus cytotoxicus]
MTKHFFARLKGEREVPPVNTNAYGVVELIFNSDLTKIHYRVIVKEIEKVISCQIHLGRKNQVGPEVLFLYGPVKHGISVDQGIVKGALTTEDLEGPLQRQTFEQLLKEIERANAYVNVCTETFKKGEIRGRIRKIKKRP